MSLPRSALGRARQTTIACPATLASPPPAYPSYSKLERIMTTQALTESDYDALATPELQRLIARLDALGDDSDHAVEAELASDILTIEFSDGTRYVLNSHRAARQIWLSAERSAWHFDYLPSSKTWVASKSGDEMWATLNRLLSAKLKTPVELRYEPVPRATRASPP